MKEALLAAFAEHLGIAPAWGEILPGEEAAAQAIYDADIGQDEVVYEIDAPARPAGVHSATHTGTGGTISAHLRLEGPAQNRIREIVFTGDFFVTPPRIVPDLESALRGVTLDEVVPAVDAFFATAKAGVLSANPSDFAQAVAAAAALA